MKWSDQVKLVEWIKKRHYTLFYCKKCRTPIGEIHKRPSKFDFWNPSLCDCYDGLDLELDLAFVVCYNNPALNFLLPLETLPQVSRYVRDVRGQTVKVGGGVT